MSMYLYIIVFIFFILFPVSIVLLSNGYSAKEKVAGSLASIFFSWAGFIVFFLLMLAKKKMP